MVIGINAAAAIKQPRTGVEEYCYQLIKHLAMLEESREHRFFLYVPSFLKGGENPFDFLLPDNFEVHELNWPLPMWTQARLTPHLLFNKPDVLFIPVHILPFVHPRNSVVTIHGLEYEYYPKMYPWRHLQYLRFSTKYAVRHARKVIAVSENTKNDLVKFYGAGTRKIEIVHHGVNFNHNSLHPSLYKREGAPPLFQRGGWGALNFPYLLFIGRIELKKNILGILEAYKILKEKYKIPHQLVLAGAPGFGYDEIRSALTENISLLSLPRADFRQIWELGYVSEEEKWRLLRGADVFLFPTFYEGFGMPILEAQSAGAPVVASDNLSTSEVAGDSAMLVDPQNPQTIADAVYKIIDDKVMRDRLIESGCKNVKRFSWEKCAKETFDILCA